MLSEKPDTEATLRDSTDANRAEQAHAEKGSGRAGAGAGGAAGGARVSLLGRWENGPVNILKATELHTLFGM